MRPFPLTQTEQSVGANMRCIVMALVRGQRKRLNITMSKDDRELLNRRHFRGRQPLAGNFLEWSDLSEFICDEWFAETVLPELLNKLMDAGGKEITVQFDRGTDVGWTNLLHEDDVFFSEQTGYSGQSPLEWVRGKCDVRPLRDGSLAIFAKNIPAPRTRLVTIVAEKGRTGKGKEFGIKILSIRPGMAKPALEDWQESFADSQYVFFDEEVPGFVERRPVVVARKKATVYRLVTGPRQQKQAG
jgi:hypothetical protein